MDPTGRLLTTVNRFNQPTCTGMKEGMNFSGIPTEETLR